MQRTNYLLGQEKGAESDEELKVCASFQYCVEMLSDLIHGALSDVSTVFFFTAVSK